MAPSITTDPEINPQNTPTTQLNCVPTNTQVSCVPLPPPITNIQLPYEKEQSLRLFLDQECHTEIAWNGIIKFPARLYKCALFPTNILKYVGNVSHRLSSNNLYFCNDIYQITEESNNMSKLPPDADRKLITKTKFKSKAFTLLSHDLCQAAIKNGFTIVRNGSQYFSAKNATIIRQRFTCQKYQKYKSSVIERNEEFRDFRKITYHYNRANQRPKGRKLSRRAYSSLAMNPCA